MYDVQLKKRIAELEKQVSVLSERERELTDGNEEMNAQKEELTAAIEAFIDKSDSLEHTVGELKRKNDELDQILYRASHDLRAPVSSMQGVLGLLKYEALSPAVSELHQHLMHQIFQMHDVLKSLSSLSYASFNSIRYERVSLLPLLNDVVASLHYLPHYSTIKFKIQVRNDLEISIDPFLFCILLKSVIGNAVTFRNGETNGEVTIKAITTQSRFDIEIC